MARCELRAGPDGFWHKWTPQPSFELLWYTRTAKVSFGKKILPLWVCFHKIGIAGVSFGGRNGSFKKRFFTILILPSVTFCKNNKGPLQVINFYYCPTKGMLLNYISATDGIASRNIPSCTVTHYAGYWWYGFGQD